MYSTNRIHVHLFTYNFILYTIPVSKRLKELQSLLHLGTCIYIWIQTTDLPWFALFGKTGLSKNSAVCQKTRVGLRVYCSLNSLWQYYAMLSEV